MANDERDIELFAEVQNGNRISFNVLFRRYYQPLCRYAFTITRNIEESEELVSDVFFNLWAKAKSITIESTFKTYVYSCVKYAALARFKSTRSVAMEVDQSVLNNIPLRSEDAQAKLEFVDLEKEFRKAVDKLPERCREVFILNRLDNLRYKEIALLLDISEKTVENHLVKAVSIIRQTMIAHRHPVT